MELLMIMIVLVAILCLLLGTGLFGAPWIPSSRGIVRKMLSMAGVKPEDVVYDLGSGDGRIMITAASEFHARSVGIEINPLWVFWTRLIVTILGLMDQAKVVWGNFFREDLSKANIVTLYLLQGTNDRLKSKLERELKPGTRVVSHVFTFAGWDPVKVDAESKIYVYTMKNQNQKELFP